jgi:hypothetical protein
MTLRILFAEKFVAEGKIVTDCKIVVYMKQNEEKVALKLFRMKRKDKSRPYEAVCFDAEMYAKGIANFLKVPIEKKTETVGRIK